MGVERQPRRVSVASTLAAVFLATVIEGQDSSRFDHARAEHQEAECSECHRRSDNDLVPSFPTHSACLVCHATDFASSGAPLCQGCHAVPIDQQASLLAFPGALREFTTGFSHHQHLTLDSESETQPAASCEDCHRFEARHPEGSFPAHLECYSCHDHQSSGEHAGCGSCHDRLAEETSATDPSTVRTATTFSLYGFSHQSHFEQDSVESDPAGCQLCHASSQQPINGQDIRSIDTRRGQEHSSGCFACHQQESEPYCTKCHASGPPMAHPSNTGQGPLAFLLRPLDNYRD